MSAAGLSAVSTPAGPALLPAAGLSADQIEAGVEWGLAQRAAGRRVLVYCTHGHGRSAVMACALLIADGVVAGPEEARALVTRLRPGAKPNARQWAALDAWYAQHGGGGAGRR